MASMEGCIAYDSIIFLKKAAMRRHKLLQMKNKAI
jgi:hypothetical protein